MNKRFEGSDPRNEDDRQYSGGCTEEYDLEDRKMYNSFVHIDEHTVKIYNPCLDPKYNSSQFGGQSIRAGY